MTHTHRLADLAFCLFAVAAFAYGIRNVPADDPQRLAADAVATPNHDPHRGSAVPAPDALADWNPEMLRAEPEAATASAAATAEPAAASTDVLFVATDTTLYARANARLRAAP